MAPDRKSTPDLAAHAARPPPVARASCIECHRLKRRCNRKEPCNMCLRYRKECSYAEFTGRPTKRQVNKLQTESERLRRLLARHAPELDIERALGGLGVAGTDDEGGDNRGETSSPAPPSPLPVDMPPEPHAALNPAMLFDSAPAPRASAPLSSPHASFPRSAQAHLRPPQAYAERAPDGRDSDLAPPYTPISTRTSDGDRTSTVDVFDRPPRSAIGYEWNERSQRSIPGDVGTSSLSLDPDGRGYLGFASGSALLRVLQICAGGIALPQHAPVPEPVPDWHPSAIEREFFIDVYFAQLHLMYPVLHQQTFRAQLHELIPRPPADEWIMLVNVVLGFGAFCSSQPEHIVSYFLERAAAPLSVELLETGSLALVQGFCLLANLTQKSGKPNAAYVYIGIASRMALGLGLHRELPYWDITPFERECRRRVWWMLFIMDSGASITLSRPVLVPLGECDVQLVHNIHDSVCVLGSGTPPDGQSFTASASEAPLPVDEPTLYSNIRYQGQFNWLAASVFKRATSLPPPSSAEALAMDGELRRWLDALPAWMRPTVPPTEAAWFRFFRQKLFWRFCNMRIIVHRRAFLERALSGRALVEREGGADDAAEVECARLCLASASETILSKHDLFVINPRDWNKNERWYGLHFLFTAAFIPLIALHTNRTSPQVPSWLDDVRRAREVVLAMQPDDVAARALKILDLLGPAPEVLQQAQAQAQADRAAIDDAAWLEALQSNPQWLGTEPAVVSGAIDPAM